MSRVTASFPSSEDIAAQSSVYQLLARLWFREVDLDLVKELRSPRLRDSFVAAGGIPPSGEDEATVEHLAIEYCRLFIGPKDHLPPYQSVWQTGQFQGKPIASMKSFIEIVGYDTDRISSGTALDHLGVQLDVMSVILRQTATSDKLEHLELMAELSQAFFIQHLSWPRQLLRAAADTAQTDFYRSVARLTSDFLEMDRDI